jgi:hypothetical protein
MESLELVGTAAGEEPEFGVNLTNKLVSDWNTRDSGRSEYLHRIENAQSVAHELP